MLIQWWDEIATRVEDQFTAEEAAALQAELEGAIGTVETATVAAQAAADNANTAATDAQTASDANARFLSISNSNVTGLTITATDAGASVTVTFSAHIRNYADGTSVAVSGGNITGLAYSSQFFYFYDQANLAGGAVTYQATASGPDALTSAANPDRHLVGSGPTPAALAAPVFGAGVVPPTFDQFNGGDWL